MLHQPFRKQGKDLDVSSDYPEMYAYTHWTCELLADICKKTSTKCVVHPHYDDQFFDSDDQRIQKILRMKSNIEQILSYGRDVFLWEHSLTPPFSSQYADELMKLVIQPLNLPLCYDISHAFIGLKGDNDALERHFYQHLPFVQYFHIVDSHGKIHDGLTLGHGSIDWIRFLPIMMNYPFIFEIQLANYDQCTEMLNSAKFAENIMKTMIKD